MKADIEAFLEGRILAAASYNPVQRAAKWVRRNRAASIAAAAVSVALLGAVLWIRVRDASELAGEEAEHRRTAAAISGEAGSWPRPGRSARTSGSRSSRAVPAPRCSPGPSAPVEEALRALREFRPGLPSHSLHGAVELARQISGPEGSLVVLSDDPRTARGAGARDGEILAAGEPRPNLALPRRDLVAEGKSRVYLVIRNFSDGPRVADLSIEAGGRSLGRAALACGEVVVGLPLARALGAGVGDEIVLEIRQGRRPLRVAGTATEYTVGGSALYMDFEPGRRLLGFALLRRVSYRVGFPLPDEALRETLWCRMLPPKAPTASDVDPAALARRFQLCGGQIRSILLRAASRAALRANGDREIRMDDLLLAAGEAERRADRRLGFWHDSTFRAVVRRDRGPSTMLIN